MVDRKRRRRMNIPAERPRRPIECAANSSSDSETPTDQARLAAELQQLKPICAHILDRVEEMLTNGQTRVRPTGRLTTEAIMSNFGALMSPIVFLTHLRSKPFDSTGPLLMDTEAAILRQSIDHAIHAEHILDEELRVTLGIAASLRLVASSLRVSTRGVTSVAFDRACATLSTAVHQMQETTGIYIDKNDILPAFTTLHVLAHVCVADTSDAAVAAPDYTAHESSQTTHFTRSTTPADLIVVSLRNTTLPDEVLHSVYHESAVSLKSMNDASYSNILHGVMFSDASAGIACLATSVLPEFGIALSGKTASVAIAYAPTLFELAFSELDVAAEERPNAPNQHFSNVWDAAPDMEASLCW